VPFTWISVTAAEFLNDFRTDLCAVWTVNFLNDHPSAKKKARNGQRSMQLIRDMREAPVVLEDANGPDHSSSPRAY